jgi:serine protease Do
VLTVDGRKVKETRDLIDYVSSKAPGEKVELGILRDGKRATRTVELTERRGLDEVTEPAGDQGVGGIDWLGLDYQDLTPHVRQTLGIPAAVSGVVVREVTAASPLYDEGVGTGDVVTEVNGQAIESSDHFENLIGGAPSGSYLRLYVRRFDPHSDDDAGIGFFAIVRAP